LALLVHQIQAYLFLLEVLTLLMVPEDLMVL
jgi:hypothetical protein